LHCGSDNTKFLSKTRSALSDPFEAITRCRVGYRGNTATLLSATNFPYELISGVRKEIRD